MVRLSILGLNEFTEGHVWDSFDVPDGISRQDAIDNILAECAELSLLYTEPEYVKFMIGLWCRKQMNNWIQLKEALETSYDPLHNYDRHEEWKDTGATQVAGFNEQPNMADRDAAQSDHEGHIYGNIGVLTSQAMVVEELQLRLRYNLLDAITQSFKDQFCIQVY